MNYRAVILACLVLLGCQSVPEDRGSAFAAEAGDKTAVLGSCNLPPDLGWSVCRWERGTAMPPLRLYFVNGGQYAVGDCFNGILSQGSAGAGQVVEIDLSPIRADIERLGFCLMKVDMVERWGDGRQTPLAGGFAVDLFDRGYLPTPPRDLVAFCRKFGRTTKGRTISEECEVR